MFATIANAAATVVAVVTGGQTPAQYKKRLAFNAEHYLTREEMQAQADAGVRPNYAIDEFLAR